EHSHPLQAIDHLPGGQSRPIGVDLTVVPPGGGVAPVEELLQPGDVFGSLSHTANLRGRPQRVPPTFRPAKNRLHPPGECATLSGTMSSDTSLIRPARPADAEAIARAHVYHRQSGADGMQV